MTENTRPKEQIAYDYRYSARSSISRPAGGRDLTGERGTRARRAETATPHKRRRIVRMPTDIVEPTSWAERRANVRRAQPEPRAHSRLVRRNLPQTGLRAPGMHVRPIRSLPKMRSSAPVPVRSGLRDAHNGSFWRRILGFFALLVIGIVGVSFAFTSPTFRVQQVDIEGTQNRVLVQSIQHMGIQGQNIFLVDAGALTARIETSPLVASASLGKQLPNQLTVTVVERTPVLLWRTKQGTFSVDSQGVVIAPASETVGADHLMTVVDVRGGVVTQQIHPGVRLNEVDIAFAAQVFTRLPQLAGISTFTLRYGDTKSVGAQSFAPKQGGSYVVQSPDGWLAYLGGPYDSNPLDNRLIELQQILRLAQQEQLSLATIDLRFGLHTVYTLKS